MILVVCLALGLLLRVASGRRLADLAHIRLRGEAVLVVLLIAQALPALLALTGPAARVGYWIWVATFPCLVFTAWMNRGKPGMVLLSLGLLLNLAVVIANGGMPVAAAAVAAVRPGLATVPIATTDFVHVLAVRATRLVWLADVIPVPGPSWLTSIASAGDCLLFAGVVAFLAASNVDIEPQRCTD